MAADNLPDEEQGEWREVRIQQLKQQAAELCGEEMMSIEGENYSPEVEEEFWEHVVAFAQTKRILLFEVLVKAGISLPPPDELNEGQLSAKLWEVIDGLLLLGIYLEHTDHLSDGELYVELWSETLRGETVLPPEDSGFSYHLDLIGSGSGEDTLIYLKYYASADERQEWAAECPAEVMPAHEQPPYDRDRHLPRSSSREPAQLM
ncbi:MAG: hypothetical protein H0W76_26190 [Pyrinomonadaceae bacterium]|nr:hypothetical protein [Pyrinomonadaceae bacterium]